MVDFAAFWVDVFLGSSLAVFTCLSAVADFLAVRPFLAKYPNRLRVRSLMGLSTNLTYPMRFCILALVFTESIMWEVYNKWDGEVGRADRAEHALELRTRQQFGRFPIGHFSPEIYLSFESAEWVTLGMPATLYDWSTVPLDADVIATIHVRFSNSRRGNCRAARVRVRDVASDAVAGESERIPYISNYEPRTVRTLRETSLPSAGLLVILEV